MTQPITAVAIALPACNEADKIAGCIAALGEAAVLAGLPAFLVVAADRCTDATAIAARAVCAISSSFSGLVTEIDYGSVGAARQVAARLAVGQAQAHGHGLSGIWLATTDADSIVDPDWLHAQLAWAKLGRAGVTGLVRLGSDADVATQDRYGRYVARLGASVGHGHVHGANLGLRADWWSRVGGFPLVVTGEDHGLWARLRAAGADVLGVTDLGVTTSARLRGRAPHGLADLLATLSA